MNYGEADRILTILTEKQGKIKAIAKGSRKILSKLAGALEPFCLVNFIFHEGKSFYIVTSAVVEKRFEKIHTDIDKTAKAFYIGELIDRALEEKQNHPEIFELFVKYLTALEESELSFPRRRESTTVDPHLHGDDRGKDGDDKGEDGDDREKGGNDNSDLLIPIFSAKILESLGFKPEVFECLHCRKKLLPEQNFWDNIEGGVICTDCHNKFGHGTAIENDVIKILRLVFSPQFHIGSQINISDKYKKMIGSVLESYTEGILERELKSKRFLKEISN